jgi:hypothetical protein
MPHTKPAELTLHDHQHDIEEAAYYKWLNRGRAGGDPHEDWIEAELEFQTNLYSDDDEVERSLISSVPDRKKLTTPQKKNGPVLAGTTGKKPLTTTSNQTSMATEQDDT